MGASILYVAVALIVLAIFVGSIVMRRRRADELRFIGRQLGLSYRAEDSSGATDVAFSLFSRGDGRGSENLLTGEWEGMLVQAFDYWYYEERRTSRGMTSRTYSRFSCAVTNVDAALWPLVVRRETALTRAADAVGIQDLEFELEEFNRTFNVVSDRPKFANDVLDQRMMRWLLSTDRTFAFETRGRWLLVYSGQLPPRALPVHLDTLKGFRDRIPRVVYDLYGPSASG
jgi:hypothetical protein